MFQFVVIGRFSQTVFGPFGTVKEAESFIRFDLRSNERFYNIERYTVRKGQ